MVHRGRGTGRITSAAIGRRLGGAAGEAARIDREREQKRALFSSPPSFVRPPHARVWSKSQSVRCTAQGRSAGALRRRAGRAGGRAVAPCAGAGEGG